MVGLGSGTQPAINRVNAKRCGVHLPCGAIGNVPGVPVGPRTGSPSSESRETMLFQEFVVESS